MFTIDQSLLLVVDVQEKLAPVIHEREKTLRHISILIKVAGFLDIPVIFTEQAPEKIGPTVAELIELVENKTVVSKLSFSCCDSPKFNDVFKQYNRCQIIVCGIESHVCVCQTVDDLLEEGLEVQVVSDATSSRQKKDKKIALQRMQDFGADITCAEMMATELIAGANHPQFKNILSLIK